MDNIQKKLEHISPPCVKIRYDVHTGGTKVLKELPYVLGIISDLSGASEVEKAPMRERKFINIAGDTFTDTMESIRPRVKFSVENKIGGDANLGVDLTFLTMDDFEPMSIIKNVPELNELYSIRTKLTDLSAKLDGNAELNRLMDQLVESGGKEPAIDTIVNDGQMYRDESLKDYCTEMVQNFIDKVLPDAEGKSAITAVNAKVASIDGMLSLQLDEILHNADFQELEGRWRGMWYLITGTDVGAHLIIRLLNVTKHELAYDLEKAVGFDQSQLFKKIYEEEYGTYGGNPYSFLMTDMDFSASQFDMELLTKLSQISAAALAPLFATLSPSMLDLDSFADIGHIRDVAATLMATQFSKWQGFRETDESRYVALVLPRVLSRAPYGPDTNLVDGLDYTESVDGTDNSKFTWMSATWAYALRVCEACNMYNWPVAIRGVENGGLVRGLPFYTFKTSDGDIALKCPTEVAITDRREKELSDAGFITLVHCKNRDYAAFFGAQTTHKPLKYTTDEATANANLSARITYILAACRFGHYLKVMIRDKIGSFMEREDMERYLNNWLASYVLLNPNPTQTLKASYPLKSGRVDVVGVPGDPGNYKAVVFMRPHFQLEEITVSLRMVATLPKPYHDQILSDLA